jgi:hypothetical protein
LFCFPANCRIGHRDCRRGENRGRHLIEQWLKDVVVSPVDQNDFGVAPPKRSRGCNPGEASADNHDPRRLVPMHLHLGGFVVSLSHDHRKPTSLFKRAVGLANQPTRRR